MERIKGKRTACGNEETIIEGREKPRGRKEK